MTTISNKELWELRELYRLTPTKKSRIDETYSLAATVANRLKYVIDNEVLPRPNIAAVTVNQLLYDRGMHWKTAKEPSIKYGLLSHAGVGRPPNWYIAAQLKQYHHAMEWPPSQLRNIITGTMRTEFLNPLLDGRIIKSGYIIGYCKGYICEEDGQAKYIPEQGRAISTYFIVREDKLSDEKLHDHILRQPWWFRKQWAMMLEKLPSMLKSWKTIGEKKIIRSETMRISWRIDENYEKCLLSETLDPKIPVSMIDWRVNQEDEDDNGDE